MLRDMGATPSAIHERPALEPEQADEAADEPGNEQAVGENGQPVL